MAEENKAEMQTLQQQLQMTMIQKHQLKMQLDETENAFNELEKSTGDVFKSAGTLLIKVDKEDAKRELSERKESIGLRMKTMESQEKKLKERLNEITGREGGPGAG